MSQVTQKQVTQKMERHWLARLSLGFEAKRDGSCLKTVRHEGPLRVQKTFQEADGSLHTYLLHPPGGLVTGDALEIDVRCEAKTDVVITTPSAGKVYLCPDDSAAQRQHLKLAVKDSHLDWLPQETIFFNGVKAILSSRIDVSGNGSYMGWEINAFGRPAAGEAFEQGEIRQEINVSIDGRLSHLERTLFEGSNSPLKSRAWGFDGAYIAGTFIAVLKQDYDGVLEMPAGDPVHAAKVGVTVKGRTVIGRYLGGSALECRQSFLAIRDELVAAGMVNVTMPRVLPRVLPRIWNT